MGAPQIFFFNSSLYRCHEESNNDKIDKILLFYKNICTYGLRILHVRMKSEIVYNIEKKYILYSNVHLDIHFHKIFVKTINFVKNYAFISLTNKSPEHRL